MRGWACVLVCACACEGVFFSTVKTRDSRSSMDAHGCSLLTRASLFAHGCSLLTRASLFAHGCSLLTRASLLPKAARHP